MSSRRVYGDAVAHSLRLPGFSARATQVLPKSQIGISRLSIGVDRLGMTATIPAEDTFIVAMYLTEVRHHELWSRGRPYLVQGYSPYSIRIVNLVEEFSAYIKYPHESLVFYIPRDALNEFTDEAGIKRIAHLSCIPGTIDPVLKHLGASLQAAFDGRGEVSQLFVDHVAMAICAHLVDTYGGAQIPIIKAKGGLTASQVARAKEYMSENCDKDISLLEVATACGLSRGYFAKAFKATTQLTPHQWRLRYRIDKAKVMLLETSSSVAEVAATCGFSDQSHLTRIFAQMVGDTPANWRRHRSK